MLTLLKRREIYFVLLISFVALLLRVFKLGEFPPSLNWDEVSHGYNAYSILKTGSDEWGKFMPIANFRAYGDYPLPFYMYLSLPWIYLLGLSETTIRLTSAIFGSLLVAVVYYLSKIIFKSKLAAFSSAVLLCLSVWSFMLNRQVLQANPAIFLLALGILLFLIGARKKHWLIPISTICLGLSAYSYHNTRILAPAIFIVLIFLYFPTVLKFKKILILSIALALIFFGSLVPIILSPEGNARSQWVGILDQGAINTINESRGNSNLPKPVDRLVFNKYTYFLKIFARNYLSYFNPQYLGYEGGSQYQYSIPHLGIIYPIELSFFYLGLVILITRFRKSSKQEKFLLFWLLLSPLPAAITRDPYQVVRSTTLIVPMYLVTGYGLALTAWFIKKRNLLLYKFFIAEAFLLVIILFTQFLINYFYIYPREYSFAWQYGYKQMAEYIDKNYDDYQNIYITKKYGEAHEFLLFYLKYDPSKYKNNPNLIRYGANNWFWVDQFDKFYFINDPEIKEKLQGKSGDLLITSPGNFPDGSKVLERINFLNGTPAFDIVKL